MKDKELKLNASGYKDEPCYQTIKAVDVPKPGEIYIHGEMGRYVLVLNHVNGVCAILTLVDQEREGRIPVMARVQMYTNPIMTNYTFASSLIQYVKTITDEEFQQVKKAVAEAFGFEHKTDNFKAEPMLGSIRLLEEKVKALEEERDAAVNVADQIHAENIDASIQLEKEKAKSQFYREMYDTLLDKLISVRGCANE